jgi:hypothetical protein
MNVTIRLNFVVIRSDSLLRTGIAQSVRRLVAVWTTGPVETFVCIPDMKTLICKC